MVVVLAARPLVDGAPGRADVDEFHALRLSAFPLDTVSQQHMVELLGGMRRSGKSVLVVTHHPALLKGVADESVLMQAGRIVARQPGIPVTTAEMAAPS